MVTGNQEKFTILNLYEPNSCEPNFIESIQQELKIQINTNLIRVGDFKCFLILIVLSSEPKYKHRNMRNK